MFVSGQSRAVCDIFSFNSKLTYGTRVCSLKSPLVFPSLEPALTVPKAETAHPAPPSRKLGSSKPKSKKREMPEGLWTKCPKCSTMIFDKELDANLKVCPKCSHHFPIVSAP